MPLAGRPRSRPLPTDAGILERITDGLVSGLSIKKVCQTADMPSVSDIYREIARNPQFATCIARARELQQDAMIDSTVDLADEATDADWQVVKLRIWARQWRAAKLAPKKYGERQTLSHEGQTMAPSVVLTPEQEERLAREMLISRGYQFD